MVLGINRILRTDKVAKPAPDQASDASAGASTDSAAEAELQEQTLIQAYDVLLVDLDGVVYTGADAIPGAVDGLNQATDLGHTVGFLTNNAARTPETVAAQLNGFGIHTDAAHIVTSPHAAVPLLASQIPAGAEVLVIGGEGLLREVEHAGFNVTHTATPETKGVIQGFAPDVAWTDLAEAAYAVSGGAVWIGTNSDWTIPREKGIAPGNGTLLSAVHTATGTMPVVAGKPERPIYKTAFSRFKGERYVAIGDRLDTDILGGNRAKIDTIIVLTGVDKAKQILAANKDERPSYIIPTLAELHQPYDAVALDGDTASCGGVTVTLKDAVLRVQTGDPTSVQALRAAAALVWHGDRPIWAMDVDERIVGEPTPSAVPSAPKDDSAESSAPSISSEQATK